MKKTLSKIIEETLQCVPERSRDILVRRFGLGDEAPQTLQAVGLHYGITRERVRQVVCSSIVTINNHASGDYDVIQQDITAYIRAHGGIVHFDRLSHVFREKYDMNKFSLRFFIEASKMVTLVEQHKKHPLSKAVHLYDFEFKEWDALNRHARAYFKEEGVACDGDTLFAALTKKYKAMDSVHVFEHLHVSDEISESPFGKWGMTAWSDVSPRNVRDKVFLVLANTDKMLHFREIAQAIDDSNLNKSARKTHPQTVHNELIKDNRFAIMGRGMYTLAGKGYIAGPVREVIRTIMKDAQKPMTVSEIVTAVKKHRNVKASTIKINLNTVAKSIEGAYVLR